MHDQNLFNYREKIASFGLQWLSSSALNAMYRTSSRGFPRKPEMEYYCMVGIICKSKMGPFLMVNHKRILLALVLNMAYK